MIGRIGFGSLTVCGLLAALIIPAHTIAQAPAPGSSAEQAAPVAQPGHVPPFPPAQVQVVMPDKGKIVLLIRTALLTLNDALQSGNYTVLRDVAAPAFREANSAARLARIFSTLAESRIDLTLVAVMAPQLTAPPTIDPNTRMLHLKGYFPGQPVQLNFQLLYQPVAGRWRLFGLSVNPATSNQAASAEGAGRHAAPRILATEPEKKGDPKKK
jgi:hypothetical protein